MTMITRLMMRAAHAFVPDWRGIPGFPLYQASACGRIRNVRTGRELSPGNRPDGYRAVRLTAPGPVSRAMLVHRAVALAWLPNAACKPTVHHLDRNRSNNAVSNLAWATSSEQNLQRGTWTRASPSPEPDLQDEVWRVCDGAACDGAACDGAACDGTSMEDDARVYVSNMGRVRRRGHVVQYAPSDPYVCVFAGGRKQYLHRLVAHAFVANDDPERKVVVNHLDGNRRNNAASNLEWCTQSDNVRHAHAAGLITPAVRAVDQVDPDTRRLIRRFESRTAAAEATGVKPAAISNALAGRAETAGGWAWRDASADKKKA